jgi:hypothetical protein
MSAYKYCYQFAKDVYVRNDAGMSAAKQKKDVNGGIPHFYPASSGFWPQQAIATAQNGCLIAECCLMLTGPDS